MASVQGFKDAEKTYYLQNYRGQRTEHAINHTEWHGQRENYFPLRHGHVAEGHHYSAEGHADMAEGRADMAQGHGDSHGHMAQGLGHVAEGLGYMAEGLGKKVQRFGLKVQGLGHKVQAQGQHSEHGMVKPMLPARAQTRAITLALMPRITSWAITTSVALPNRKSSLLMM
ncbi:hypothetical protein ACJRO7_018239 [Eucalyptus globulus]|uniref:Uncharacterized protein n=1 Tax=Eucalyptus globulus TaxID=34317 RepID=A0ABD3KZQ1_EUCGL